MSYIETVRACNLYGVEFETCFVSCSLVTDARILCAQKFLESDFSHLFFIDADIQWTATDFLKVLLKARTRDCVVGIYPRRRDPPAYFVRFVDKKALPDEEGLLEIEGTGLGFACIQRKVIERIAETQPKLKYPFAPEPVPRLFRIDDDGTNSRGEDYAFWADVREQGFRVWADATCSIGHIGKKLYTCPAFS
jgi:hypothetical protein